MSEADSTRLKLLDAFDVLRWAGITEAISESGDHVRIENRGYSPDRVRARNRKAHVHELNMTQLFINRTDLGFIGQYSRLAFLKLEIDAERFIRIRAGFPKPNSRSIRVAEKETESLITALKSDVQSSARAGLPRLSRYLKLIGGFCSAWNGGDIHRLVDSTAKLRTHAVGDALKKLAARLYQSLPSFQNFFISRRNLSAALALREISEPTRFFGPMTDKLRSAVSDLLPELIDQNRLKDALKFAQLLPDPQWRKAIQEKISRLHRQLPGKLTSLLLDSIRKRKIETATSVIQVAKREAITELDSIDVDRFRSWLDAIIDYPDRSFREAAKDLKSFGTGKALTKEIKATLVSRVAERVVGYIEAENFGGALSSLLEATEATCIIEQDDPDFLVIQTALLRQLKHLKSQARIDEPASSYTIKKIAEATALCDPLHVGHSELRDLIETRLITLKEQLAAPNTKPRSALDCLSELRPLEAFFPQDFPIQQLDTFLQAANNGNLAQAHQLINTLIAAGIPIDPMLLQTAQRAVNTCIRKIESDNYANARAYYFRRRKYFIRHTSLRKKILTSFSACRRRKELAFFKESIERAFGEICSVKYDLEIEQPELEQIDYELIAKWNDLSTSDREIEPWQWDTLHVKLGSYKLMQHVSARSSEKASLVTYKNLYGNGRDISAEQVTDASEDWKAADVSVTCSDVQERHIDIKSARSSFARKDRYSEFCIKSFKEDQRGKEIALSAFFSEYKGVDQFSSGDFPTYLWLGEFSKSTALGHIDFIEKYFGSIFELEGFRRTFGSERFLPGWTFDYPPPQYATRDHSLIQLQELVTRALRRDAIPTNLSTPLLVLTDAPARNALSRSERLVVGALRAMVKEHGLHRGLLFLAVIAGSITAMKRGWSEFRPSVFKQFLNLDSEDEAHFRPLGILDPLGYVEELIDCLDIVFDRSGDEIVRFRTFRLVGHGILQAKKAGESDYTTILAYCGGRNQMTKVRCGNSPLVVTIHQNCKSCGKLICDKCDFCSEQCPNCYRRETETGYASPQQSDSALKDRYDPDFDIPF